MATKHQFFIVNIPKGLSAADRETLGEEIISFIQDQTKQGKSWRGRDFAGYSDSYANSINFKIAGKSKDDVNLTQSGDTLGAITVLENEDGKLKIGFEAGSQENAIADGNIRGTYGQSKTIGPKRDFLGITKGNLQKILDHFTPEDAAAGKGARKGVSEFDDSVTPQIEESDDG